MAFQLHTIVHTIVQTIVIHAQIFITTLATNISNSCRWCRVMFCRHIIKERLSKHFIQPNLNINLVFYEDLLWIKKFKFASSFISLQKCDKNKLSTRPFNLSTLQLILESNLFFSLSFFSFLPHHFRLVFDYALYSPFFFCCLNLQSGRDDL